METKIVIKGAKENNLKNIDLELPKNSLIVFSGLSGSGKTTLAFDTIFAEGQRRYMESLSSYARQFLGNYDKPNVDSIDGQAAAPPPPGSWAMVRATRSSKAPQKRAILPA